MAEKLKLINIPAAREAILKSIAEYRYLGRLCDALEPMLREFTQKRVDCRIAGKLKERFDEQHRGLMVTRVLYTPLYNMTSHREFYIFIGTADKMAGWEEYKFNVREVAGHWDIDDTFISHRKWAKHADFLERSLAGFNENAAKFNDHLRELHPGLGLIEGRPIDQNCCRDGVVVETYTVKLVKRHAALRGLGPDLLKYVGGVVLLRVVLVV